MILGEVYDPKNQDIFNCDKCAIKNCDEGNPANFDRWHVEGVITSRVCLKPMIGDYEFYLYRLFAHYKRGNLVHGGGVNDQPNAYLQMMELLGDRLGYD